MGFDRINLIRGVVVNFDKVLEYFASVGKLQHIVDRINEDKIYPVEFTGSLVMNNETLRTITEWFAMPSFADDNDWLMLENFIENSFSEDFVHTWPCCSKLRMEKFVLGYGGTIPEKGNLYDCFKGVCTLEDVEIKTNNRDEEILAKLKLIGLGTESLKTMIIPDGCINCT